MKLKNLFIYASRVDLSSSSAQSKQIQCMIEEFNNQVCRFKSVNVNSSNKYSYNIPQSNSKIITLKNIIKKIFLISQNERAIVYTREIGIASASILLRNLVFYEMHKYPKSFLVRSLISLLTKLNLLNVIFISKGLQEACSSVVCNLDKNSIIAHDGAFETISRRDVEEKFELILNNVKKAGGCLFLHTGALHKGGWDEFQRLITTIDDNDFFLHIGGTESECATLQDISDPEKFKSLFHPAVPHEICLELQKRADVLFYVNSKENPLYMYTSPLKIFEYMAARKPIVATDGGATREILNEENAFLYLEDCTESLASTLTLAQDLTVIETKVHNAYQDFKTKYTWSKRVHRILEFVIKKTT